MALTTVRAAAICGMTPGAFRAHMTRERQRGNDLRLQPEQWLDRRTPLYDDARVQAWAESRNR